MPLPSVTSDAVDLSSPRSGGETGICSTCGMAFFPIKYKNGCCVKCGVPTCDSCLAKAPSTDRIPSSILLIPSPLCPKCISTISPDMKHYQEAIDCSETIVVYPQTSKAKTGIDIHRPTEVVHSDGCETYQDAELQLKVACVFLGYDMVIERNYSKQQLRGSYVRSEWIASGRLCYRSV